MRVILTNKRYHALLNETDFQGESPFLVACGEGQEQVVATLVELGEELIDWNAQSMYKHSGFSVACRNNCLPVVNLLLELLKEKLDGFNFNIGFEGACRKGHLPVVNRLLEVADSRNIDIESGLWEAERGREPCVVAAILTYMAQTERQSDPLTQTKVTKE